MAIAWANDKGTTTVDAGADLSSSQYYAVKLNGSAQAVVCSAAGERPLGVLQNDPAASGRSASVLTHGVTPAVAGGSVTEG